MQESLVGEVVPDPMEGEQTWPTDEELKAAKGERDHVIHAGCHTIDVYVQRS